MKTPFYKPVLKPVLVMLVLMLSALACTMTPATQQPTQPLLPTAVPVLPPTEAPTQVPTAAPTLAPTPVPTTSGRLVTFENVSFVVPEGLSESEQGNIVAPVTGGAAWEVTVEHTAFNFTGYLLPGTSRQPAIYIFPTEGFDQAAETIFNLKDLLALRPADSNPMPFLPPTNATQMFRSQVKYMDFGSGSGVRFLTQDGQGIVPVNSRSMFYTFQGLTSDGRYYISVIMPMANSALPASSEGADLEKLSADYISYLAGISTQLDTQPDNTFTPTLAVLDALVQSITVK